MIPAPIPADFARSAEKDYYPYTLSGLEWGSGACWIRLAEHYRIGRQALLKREAKAIELVRKLEAERDKLQKFKDFVHAYLTQHGVPEDDATNEHSKEGCRIGARLDLLFAERDRLGSENEELRRRIQLCSGSCRLPGD